MNRPQIAVRVVDRLAAHREIVISVAAGLATAMIVLWVFIAQAASASMQVNARDQEIARLAVNYAKLRDQDFTLGIVPAAPSLAQVETPVNGPEPPLLPRSFTAAFPTGYFTCTDVTGDRNYTCTVTTNPPRTTTTVGHR